MDIIGGDDGRHRGQCGLLSGRDFGVFSILREGKGGVGPLFANGRRLGKWVGRIDGG